MHTRRLLPRAIVTALMALLVLAGGALAQTAQGTISVTVLPPANSCVPADNMTVAPLVYGDPIEVQNEGGASTNDYYSSFQINVENASCNPWSITAEVEDFTLETDNTKTFPGSTLILHEVSQGFDNPNTWDDQPEWVQNLPVDLDTGAPTMPDQVTFSGSPAVGSESLLTASTAEYGSPGNYTVYYWTSLTGVPADLTPGSYTSKITITVQGND